MEPTMRLDEAPVIRYGDGCGAFRTLAVAVANMQPQPGRGLHFWVAFYLSDRWGSHSRVFSSGRRI
ncbi:hypothetical protein SAMN03159463_05301 [Mesorhizobium sp. NFR06]|nr:hypothetical protein SAMN03159463_05301 [Mesorhizobium sp. NFR06]